MNGHAVYLCLLTLLAGVLSAQKKAVGPLRSQVEAEFAGKEFQTKIVFGSLFSERLSTGETVTRAVDTELSPSGEVRYYARALLVRGFHIKPESISLTLPAGSRVLVKKVEFMGDRIELQFSGTRGNEYAKLKLMLGKGYEQRLDFNGVVRVIARALRIERLERQQALESEFEALKERMATAEANMRSFATETDRRLEAMEDLRRTLEQLKQNRSAYASLTGQSLDTSEYSARVAELDRAIPALKEEAKKRRIAAVRRDLKAHEDRVAGLRAGLQTKPASLKQWETQMDLLKRWDESLSRIQNLHLQMAAEGEPATPAEVTALAKNLQEARDAQKTLENMRRELQLVEMDNDYKEMERTRLQLLDSYTRAFGTTNQRREAARVLAHLELMYKNRTAAVEMGSKEAAAQAARLLKELERVKRQQ